MTTTKTRAANYLGRCANGHAHRFTTEQVMTNRRVSNDGDRFPCTKCNRLVIAKAIKGTHNPAKICDARCVGAVRHVCDCSCGGDNHGGAHA